MREECSFTAKVETTCSVSFQLGLDSIIWMKLSQKAGNVAPPDQHVFNSQSYNPNLFHIQSPPCPAVDTAFLKHHLHPLSHFLSSTIYIVHFPHLSILGYLISAIAVAHSIGVINLSRVQYPFLLSPYSRNSHAYG